MAEDNSPQHIPSLKRLLTMERDWYWDEMETAKEPYWHHYNSLIHALDEVIGILGEIEEEK